MSAPGARWVVFGMVVDLAAVRSGLLVADVRLFRTARLLDSVERLRVDPPLTELLIRNPLAGAVADVAAYQKGLRRWMTRWPR